MFRAVCTAWTNISFFPLGSSMFAENRNGSERHPRYYGMWLSAQTAWSLGLTLISASRFLLDNISQVLVKHYTCSVSLIYSLSSSQVKVDCIPLHAYILNVPGAWMLIKHVMFQGPGCNSNIATSCSSRFTRCLTRGNLKTFFIKWFCLNLLYLCVIIMSLIFKHTLAALNMWFFYWTKQKANNNYEFEFEMIHQGGLAQRPFSCHLYKSGYIILDRAFFLGCFCVITLNFEYNSKIVSFQPTACSLRHCLLKEKSVPCGI